MLAMLREQGGGDVAVPPTIQALLQARIDSLEPDVRIVLERGAIEGEVFHRGAVAELVPEAMGTEVEMHLASLVRKELVWPERALTPGEEAYRFRHILVREVVYGSMPKVLRAELHERFAGRHEERTRDPAFELDEIVGYHLEQSVTLRAELGRVGPADDELAARAAAHLLAAGRGALGRADLHAAVGLLQRGVDLVPAGDPARPEALVDLARALQRRGELERTHAVLQAAIEEARDAGDGRNEGLARLALNSLLTRVDPDSAVEGRLSEAVEIAASFERSGDLAHLARAHADIGMCRFMIGHAGEGQADLRRAAELARQVGDRALEREVLNTRLRPIAWGPTPAAEGAAYSTMLVESDITNVSDKAHALQVRSMCFALQGDVEELRRSSSRAWGLIEEFGLTMQQAVFAMDVGFAHAVVDDLDEAERVLRRGHEFLVGIGDTGSRCTVDGLLADVLFRQGRYEEAEVFAAESRATAGVDDLDAQPRWRAALARVLSVRGEHEEAEALAREAVALVEPIDLVVKATAYDALGEVLARAGKAEDAADAVERAIALHEQKGNVVSTARARALLGELRASRPS
jgi:tetratricopeptide (TPR) repeat protein